MKKEYLFFEFDEKTNYVIFVRFQGALALSGDSAETPEIRRIVIFSIIILNFAVVVFSSNELLFREILNAKNLSNLRETKKYKKGDQILLVKNRYPHVVIHPKRHHCL